MDITNKKSREEYEHQIRINREEATRKWNETIRIKRNEEIEKRRVEEEERRRIEIET